MKNVISKICLVLIPVLSHICFANTLIVDLTPGQINKYVIDVAGPEVKVLHIRNIENGFLDCQLQTLSNIAIDTEVLIVDNEREQFRDRFFISDASWHRIEQQFIPIGFDKLQGIGQAFFSFLSSSVHKQRVTVTCKHISLSRQAEQYHHITSSYVDEHQVSSDDTDNRDAHEESDALGDDVLMVFLLAVKKDLHQIRLDAQHNHHSVVIAKAHIANQFLELAKHHEIKPEHTALYQVIQKELHLIENPGDTKFDFIDQQKSSNILKQILQILPSAQSFLRDMIDEIESIDQMQFSSQEHLMLDNIKVDILYLIDTIEALPFRLKIEGHRKNLERDISAQLANRLQSIYQFVQEKGRRSKAATQNQKSLSSLKEKVFNSHLEIRNHFILSLMSATDTSHFSTETNRLIQASCGLHDSIRYHVLDQTNSENYLVNSDKLSEESKLYYYFIKPESVELVPIHQWDRRRTMLPTTRFDINPATVHIPLPHLPWLGKRQVRVNLPTQEAANSSGTDTWVQEYTRPKLKNKKRTSVLRKQQKKSRNRKMQQSAQAAPPLSQQAIIETDIERTSVSTISAFDEDAAANTHTDVSDIDSEDSSSYSSDNDVDSKHEREIDEYWLSMYDRKWDPETKDAYSRYLKRDSNTDENDTDKQEDVAASSYMSSFGLKGHKLKTWQAFQASAPGVRWRDFTTLCRQLDISLDKQGRGGSHRILRFGDTYLGTVWKPHGVHNSMRFGAGQTKLIRGYFSKYQQLVG